MAHWVHTYPHTVYASVLLLDNKIINWKIGDRRWTDIFSMTRRIRRDRPFNINDYTGETVESIGFEVNNSDEHDHAFAVLAKEWFKNWEVHPNHEGGPAYREPRNYWNEARQFIHESNCLRRKYAAIIVGQDGWIIGSGANQAKNPCTTCARENIEHNTGDYAECHSVHAEAMAMLQAGKDKLRGSTLYLVCDQDDNPTPCPICQRMMDYCGGEVRREQDG